MADYRPPLELNWLGFFVNVFLGASFTMLFWKIIGALVPVADAFLRYLVPG
jgi:hypothetical protein